MIAELPGAHRLPSSGSSHTEMRFSTRWLTATRNSPRSTELRSGPTGKRRLRADHVRCRSGPSSTNPRLREPLVDPQITLEARTRDLLSNEFIVSQWHGSSDPTTLDDPHEVLRYSMLVDIADHFTRSSIHFDARRRQSDPASRPRADFACCIPEDARVCQITRVRPAWLASRSQFATLE